ncbi:MAG TPA: 2-hydroxyacid dehydrogenase [Acidobacteriaceae bacterium]|jgi:phosphoglycerate dehydrogenase-like enzyme|nr:2-hydroxyacid dehydrogenase [Acidobacteriaceae bacterium]
MEPGNKLRVGVPEAFDRGLDRLLPDGIDLQVIPTHPERIHEVEFWIAPWGKHAEEVWAHLRGVRVVQSVLAGVDALLKLLPRDVTLCDARGVHNISTSEWVVAAILASLKQLPFYGEVQLEGVWSRRRDAESRYLALHPGAPHLYPPVLCEELHGKRVLIVGYGAIGSAIEDRLKPFGVEVTRVARAARAGVHAVQELPQLLPHADILVLTVPFTSDTRGMIGVHELALLQPGTLLVNAARGPVVDTNALIAALHAQPIRAAIDVTDPEPLPDGHPLWSAPNLLITPHIAGSTPMFMARAMAFAGQQAGRCLRGEPLENIVSGEY